MVLLFNLLIIQIGLIFIGANDEHNVSQIHMAQGKDPSSMTISWVTPTNTNSHVKYGRMPSQLNELAEGDTVQYSFNYYPDYKEYQSGVIHHVVLEGLSPSTTYFYQCGDTSIGDEGMSGVKNFKTLPAVGDKKPITFGVVGDLGQTSDSEVTVEHMLENERLQLILHAGDMSYADCEQTRWDTWADMVEVLSQER